MATDRHESLRRLFERADRDVRVLGLNFYKKAKFANSFKWRLLENGIDRGIADKVTERLVLHVSLNKDSGALDNVPAAASPDPSRSRSVRNLLGQGNTCFARGASNEAITRYQELL